MRLILLFFLILGAGCAAKQPRPAPPSQAQAQAQPEAQNQAQTNEFQKFYTQRLASPAVKPDASPRIFRGQDQRLDAQHLLEDGYDLLGYSSFEGGDVPPEQALAQATNIHADVVLVYTKGNGVTITNDKDTAGKSDDTAPEGKPSRNMTPHYQYLATFWTKLPPPVLGLHVQDIKKNTSPGLPVVAVVKNSPAEAADIHSGDLLLRMGDVELHDADTLNQAIKRYTGKSVEIVFSREAETLHRTVVLNANSN